MVSNQEIEGSIDETTGALTFQFDVVGNFAGSRFEATGFAASSSVVAVAPIVTAGSVTWADIPGDSCLANVTLTASASSLLGLPVTITYIVDGQVVGTGASVTIPLSAEVAHDVIIVGTDSNGMTDTVTESVTPSDTLPPVLTIANDGSGYAGTQWPPDHNYVAHTLADCIAGHVVDNCDGVVDVNTVGKIVRITSNEPENAPGDGNISADMIITGPSSFELRNERSGSGTGRVYTVEFTVSDDDNNAAVQSCAFQVPHDKNGKPTVAGTPAYCVETNCGTLPGNDPNCSLIGDPLLERSRP